MRWLISRVRVAAEAIWRRYAPFVPEVRRVPAVPHEGPITVLGKGFGEAQGASRVVVHVGDRSLPLSSVMEWGEKRIVALLPDGAGTGTVQVIRRLPVGELRSEPVPFVVCVPDMPGTSGRVAAPVEPDAPWPLFRRDHQNSGRSPIRAKYHGDKPWSFQTGKGIFSTPIIDAEGAIYIGSADHWFYALNPDGTLKWKYETGEVIDSAGALTRVTGCNTIVVPSGDGYLYCLQTQAAPSSPMERAERVVWQFDARVSPRATYNNWFEGNVAVGYDGTLYVGNTNFNYYAVTSDGQLKWTYETGANNWSIAGLGDDGTIYWGSNDTRVRAVRPDGTEKWTKRTLGFIAASAAVGSDGTVYLGSFDSYLYALDPDTGKTRWKFKTGDHIYCSAALGADAEGNTNAIYIGSTDGSLYALSPNGELRWRYETGAPIRSSPVLGRGPEGERGDIVYFGSGTGKLYALNAADGSRRWAYDTTSSKPELRDRNDLNASPALGETGIFIGGEHGQVWYVPYDYPLHVEDPAGARGPGSDLPDDVCDVVYVTPGGRTEWEAPTTLAPATIITLRLVVRAGGQTRDARMRGPSLLSRRKRVRVTIDPSFPVQTELSADGRYLHVIPEGILEPGRQYTVTVEGDYVTGGLHIGNLTLGGRREGHFRGTLAFQAEVAEVPVLPLAVDADEVTALEWTRLALPIPTMMPSLNQIGFDYMDWILGTAAITEPDANGTGKCLLWAVGARRDDQGVLVADPETDFTLPLSGEYRGDAFLLTNRSFTMAVTGIPIPFNLLQLRGRLGPDLAVKPGATVYADTKVLSIPTFGPYLVMAGLANEVYRKLLVTGTYVTRPYDARGSANKRPAGIETVSVTYSPPDVGAEGRVAATLRLAPGTNLPLSRHRPGILLVDSSNTEAVSLDYHANLTARADAAGNLATITLVLPAGTKMPAALEAVVLVDVFPIHREFLAPPTSH